MAVLLPLSQFSGSKWKRNQQSKIFARLKNKPSCTMRFGREIAFSSYNTPTVPADWVSQSLPQTSTVPLPGQCKGHKWRIHSQGAASQLGLFPMKGSHVQARIPRARGKYVVCLFGVVFFYYEIRLIAWELVDKRSSQQMQEVSKEEHEPQQFWGHRAQNIKAGMV